MIHLARAELLKLRSTRTAMGLGIATAVVALVPSILLVALLPIDDLSRDQAATDLIGVSALVPYVLLVFGILGMTNEYRHGTITYTYLATPRRWQVMVVKLAVYALVGMVLMLLTLVAVHLVVLIGGEARGVSMLTFGDLDFVDYARQIVVAGLMTAFGVSLGALFRAQVPTVASVLIWALAVEGIIAAFKPAVGTWLPFVVFAQVTGGRLGGDTGVGLGRPEAFLVSIAYIGIASVAAVYLSMRRDVT